MQQIESLLNRNQINRVNEVKPLYNNAKINRYNNSNFGGCSNSNNYRQKNILITSLNFSNANLRNNTNNDYNYYNNRNLAIRTITIDGISHPIIIIILITTRIEPIIILTITVTAI